MKTKVIGLLTVVVVLAVAGTAAQAEDFVLRDSEHLNVGTSYTQGILFGDSTADVGGDGYISRAYVNNEAMLHVRGNRYPESVEKAYVYNNGRVEISRGKISTIDAHDNSHVDISGGSVSGFVRIMDIRLFAPERVNISGGTVNILSLIFRIEGNEQFSFTGNPTDVAQHGILVRKGTVNSFELSYLYTTGNSHADISGGSIGSIFAHDNSHVGISGGSVSDKYNGLLLLDSSHADISGGSVNYLNANGNSTTTISGGEVSNCQPHDTGTVDITGGNVDLLRPHDSSTTILHGYDFHATGGLTLREFGIIEGIPQYEVLGSGLLIGQWRDGTDWVTTIINQASHATVLAVPEPATLAMLALGGLALLRRKRSPGRASDD